MYKAIFWFAPFPTHPCPSTGKTLLDNSPPPGTNNWTCPGGCLGGGMVTGGTEPRITITTNYLSDRKHSDQLIKIITLWSLWLSCQQISSVPCHEMINLQFLITFHSTFNSFKQAYHENRIPDHARNILVLDWNSSKYNWRKWTVDAQLEIFSCVVRFILNAR